MAWANLHDVTKTLTTLLDQYIVHVLEPGFTGLSVTDQIPTTLNNASKTLNLYLYHAREDPSGRNLMAVGADRPPAPYTSLGLELFYLLTAHHTVMHTADAEMQQKLMGYAIKTFHDVALITDATAVSGAQILASGVRGNGNRFEIVPRNPTAEEALSIWTTGNREFTRLGSYYAVRAVFLDPLPARTEPGVVLSLGALVRPISTLSLGDSHSTVRFTLPDGTAAQADAGPGVAFLAPAPDASPAAHPWPNPDAVISIDVEAATGQNLRLTLRNPAWSKLAPPLEKVVFDPALNAAQDWKLDIKPSRITLQIGSMLRYRDDAGTVQTVTMYPGECTAALEAVLSQSVVSGTLRTQVQSSNETTFLAAPRVEPRLFEKTGATYRIALAGGSSATATLGGQPLDVRFSVGGQIYTRTSGAPSAGQFAALAAANFTNPDPPHNILVRDAIAFTPFASAPVGIDLSARLTIGGAAAQPFWVKLS